MKRIGRASFDDGKRTERTFFSFERESQKGIEKLRNSNRLSSSVEDINSRIDRRVYAEKKKRKRKKNYSVGLKITIAIAALIATALLISYLFDYI